MTTTTVPLDNKAKKNTVNENECTPTGSGASVSGVFIIKSHFKTIHTVKGRPRYPESQGSVERSNGTFKNCLNDWRVENPEGSWAKIGVYVVNA